MSYKHMIRSEADHLICPDEGPTSRLAILYELATMVADELDAHIEIHVDTDGPETSMEWSPAFQREVVTKALDSCLQHFPEDVERIASYRVKLDELGPDPDEDGDDLMAGIDAIGRSLNNDILSTARIESSRLVGVAVLRLTLPSGEHRIVTYVPNYEDDDGKLNMEQVRNEIIADGQLQPGEQLDVVIKHYPL